MNIRRGRVGPSHENALTRRSARTGSSTILKLERRISEQTRLTSGPPPWTGPDPWPISRKMPPFSARATRPSLGFCVIIAAFSRGPRLSISVEQKERWLYELGLNGFILFRNFLPLDLVESMFDEMQPIVRGELSRVTAGDTSSMRGRNRMSFDIRFYIEKLQGPLDDDRFRRNPVIEELVTAVLGRWRYGVTKAECPCKDSDLMAWHPDTESTGDPNDPVRPSRLTFNVPLVDVNDANGPMEVIPGSHRMHHHEVRRHIYFIPAIYHVKLLLRRGDALLRDGKLLHRGTTNVTDAPRILLDQTYRALEATSA